MKRILSIDGGGIRGIIPGMILKYLEKQLQLQTKDKKARIANYFDFFAGTITGGILTCAYLTPDSISQAKFSAAEAIDLYLKNGEKIFRTSKINRWRAKYRTNR